MKVPGGYRPSALRFRKYSTYLSYFLEYIRNRDFRSLAASFKYVLSNKLPKADYVARSGMGDFLIRKNTTDFQFINRAYERQIKDWMMAHIDEFDVFVDVGACIGEYSIWMAKMGKRSIAIEPVNFAALHTNVKLNNVQDRVTLIRSGVGNKKERVFFNVLEQVTSSSHVVWNAQEEPNTDIDLIDNLATSFSLRPGDRVLMKMDIEGMEVEAIEGAKSFISNTSDLKLIYEHFIEDNYRNDHALQKIASFQFKNIDDFNRLAVKEAS